MLQGGENRDAWFAEGLRFECQRCGVCCSGGPGFVWVDEAEIAVLAALRGLSLDGFGRGFLRLVGERHSLIEKPDGDCVFYEEGRCTVYQARPKQCRTYPFWPKVLASRKAWDKEARSCAGMGRGRLYGIDELKALIRGEAGTE